MYLKQYSILRVKQVERGNGKLYLQQLSILRLKQVQRGNGKFYVFEKSKHLVN